MSDLIVQIPPQKQWESMTPFQSFKAGFLSVFTFWPTYILGVLGWAFLATQAQLPWLYSLAMGAIWYGWLESRQQAL